MAVASVADNDRWQGNWRMALTWLLTAAGVPVGRAEALVDEVTPDHFAEYVPLRATDVVDVAERLARAVLGGDAAAADEWPDTWPQGWPAWRATNTTGAPSVIP